MLCTCFCHSLICRSSRHVKWVVSGHCCHSILALLVSITECEQVTHLPGFKTSSGRCDQNIRARTRTYRIPQVALWRHESWICFNSSRWILHHAFFLVKLSVWFFLYCTVFENHRKSGWDWNTDTTDIRTQTDIVVSLMCPYFSHWYCVESNGG